MSRPLRDGLGEVGVCNKSRASFIGCLLLPCRPATVAWFVVLVIVNAIKRVAWRWTIPHVGEKVLKRMSPALAYANSATAIIREGWNVWICASGIHALPDSIFSRAKAAMFSLEVTSVFTTKAAARLILSVSEALGRNRGGLSAVAFASPSDFPIGKSYRSDSSKPVKCLSSEIYTNMTDACKMLGRHRRLLPTKGVQVLRLSRTLQRLAMAAFIIWNCWSVANAQDGHTDIYLDLIKTTDADTLEGDVVMVAEPGENLYWQVSVDKRPITVKLLKQRIRVANVDAHELATDKGKTAKLSVEKLLVGKTVKLTPRGKDNFGRLLAIVTLVDEAGNEIVLADWLIKNGHGVAYRRN